MNILIIEDSPDLAELVETTLLVRWADARNEKADAGQRELDLLTEHPFNIVILDLGLPDMDGLEVLTKIRGSHEVPVLILTARGGELARVRGLESGADDYLEKPFSHLELLARANALTRRGGIVKNGAVKAGELTINLATYTLTRSGEEIKLSGSEWRLLSCLMQNAGKIADNRTLAKEVWRSDLVDQDVIKTAMRRLRVKLGSTPSDDLIKTHRGLGYSFVPVN